MRVARGPSAWARRALLAFVLIGAAVVPGRASTHPSHVCVGYTCRAPGSVLWTRRLPGSWLAQGGLAGTVNRQGAAYAATGGGVTVVGFGTTVAAFKTTTGRVRWQVSVSGVPPGSQIVGVRAFSGEVAVGMQPPAGQSPWREEVILSAATGLQLRTYPAASYGGAVAASQTSTVIVGTHAVTSYANSNGRVLWTRPTGQAEEAWRVAAGYLYVAQSSQGYLGQYPVKEVRRISLSTGAERTLRTAGQGFVGTLAGAVTDVMLFAGQNGVWAYSGENGKFLWHRAGAVLELTDASTGTVYTAERNTLVGVSALTGEVISTAPKSVAGSLYWVSHGVALGLDQGALGEAWGYRLASRRVVWNSSALPWPHFFVDLSGLGGSARAGSSLVLLAVCAQVGTAARPLDAPACKQPELVAVRT